MVDRRLHDLVLGPPGANGAGLGHPRGGDQDRATRFSREQVAGLVDDALNRKLALSFKLPMYGDGSVPPESLDVM